jgi:phosphatidylglycerol:prolipoprotein diacylglycerol transferase
MQPVISLGPWALPSYSTALIAAIALSALVGWRLWRGPARAWTLICVAVLAGGVLGGRMAHVLAHWGYFQFAPGEALRLDGGGLDWWGAALGGLGGAALAARVQRRKLAPILDALTPALPLLALAGSLGCWAATCAYGAEVPTLAGVSTLVAAELPDVYGLVAPRYQTQLWMAGWSLLLLGLVGVWFWRGWLARWRFWLALALVALGMAIIGPYRA